MKHVIVSVRDEKRGQGERELERGGRKEDRRMKKEGEYQNSKGCTSGLE